MLFGLTNSAASSANNSGASPQALLRPGSNEELEWLRSCLPQAFDHNGLFDANTSVLLIRNGLVPAHIVPVLQDRIHRETHAINRTIPDVSGRRLAYEPGAAAMSGLDRDNLNLGSMGEATKTRAATQFQPVASRSQSSSPRPKTSTSHPQASSRAQGASKAPAINRSAGPVPSANSSSSWTDEEIELLLSLRAQKVSYPECTVSIIPSNARLINWPPSRARLNTLPICTETNAMQKHFPGRTQKSISEKFYKTKILPAWSPKWDEACKKYGGGRQGPPPPPSPPAPAV